MRPMLASLYQGITHRGLAIMLYGMLFMASVTLFDSFTPQKPTLAPKFARFVGISVLQSVKRKKVACL